MSAFIDNRGDYDVRSVGPFESWPVMVNGWTVPNLEARYAEQGVTLDLDSRFALDLPTELAASVISFIANATAIALGWSCHPTSPDWKPPEGNVPPIRAIPWRRLHGIDLAAGGEE